MKKTEPRRVVVALLSVAYIIYMWVKKDIAGIWGSLSKEELLPLVLTSVGVSVVKVALIAGSILLIRWILSKFIKK